MIRRQIPLSRRRFLAITAALPVAHAAQARTHRWQGRAFGADISITLPDGHAQLLRDAQNLLREVEAEFSLYDPASALSQLNRTGRLRPSDRFATLMAHAERIHHATDGLFDPTIQPQWRALANGLTPPPHIAWNHLTHDPDHIQLAQGQELTFNGIAQGFATDLVSDLLHRAGLTDTLINIGEYKATGGPWRLALEDPSHGQLATRVLHTGAIATSSPGALSIDDHAHILHPNARAQWSTISVEAADATTADGISTALTLAPEQTVRKLPGRHGITRVTAIDFDGNLASYS